jgi:hypothetical protein
MNIPLRAPWLAALLLASAACADEAADPDVVARAGSMELRADDIVELLLDEEDLPASADVVEALAGLWIDYALLTRAAAEDTTLAQLDFSPMVRAAIDQEMLVSLRDSTLQVDTLVSDQALMSRFETSDTELRFRARHIMLGFPVQATPEQRDSVRAALAGVRDQISRGARFEDLARQYSQDRGSAAQGGDLGYFAPGELVSPFEDAVRALDVGQVSEIVETPMGLHVIRLEERERPPFEEVAERLRVELQAERVQQAESLFVAGVEGRAGALELAEGALQVLRDLAGNASVRLSGRAAARELVTWSGGALTASRVLAVLRVEPPTFHEQVVAAPDETLEPFLLSLARRELLLAEARAAGLEPPQSQADSLTAEVQGQVREASRRVGLIPLERAPGERLEPAIQRAVINALRENLSGASPTVPLGPVSYQLRSETGHAILNAGIGRAVLDLGRERAARATAEEPTPPATDSTGS